LANAAEVMPDGQDRRQRIERFIKERHARGDGLADLAKRLHLSPTRTSHAVRELCGAPLRDLLEQARLATAQELLRSSALPITEVAKASGFADPSRFQRRFRQAFGVSPGVWRKQPASG
jgi:AraC family transcriptional regulator